MGLDGEARVLGIDPCPEIEPDDGTGRMIVTGTMKHLAANVLEVEIAGEPEPLGVTDTHPIWSEDRHDFVVAGQLRTGERLKQSNGTLTQVTRITPMRGPPVMVYNLEIDGEHVYHVGANGLLVHNACDELLGSGLRDRGSRLGQEQGREFRTDQLGTYEFDPNQPAHVRGWLENESRRIAQGRASEPRTPPGYVQAHGRTTPAREGYDYSNSRLQGIDLNNLEERIRRAAGQQ